MSFKSEIKFLEAHTDHGLINNSRLSQGLVVGALGPSGKGGQYERSKESFPSTPHHMCGSNGSR